MIEDATNFVRYLKGADMVSLELPVSFTTVYHHLNLKEARLRFAGENVLNRASNSLFRGKMFLEGRAWRRVVEDYGFKAGYEMRFSFDGRSIFEVVLFYMKGLRLQSTEMEFRLGQNPKSSGVRGSGPSAPEPSSIGLMKGEMSRPVVHVLSDSSSSDNSGAPTPRPRTAQMALKGKGKEKMRVAVVPPPARPRVPPPPAVRRPRPRPMPHEASEAYLHAMARHLPSTR